MKNQTKQNDVLFQKIGSTWYAFTEIDGEVFFREIPQHLDPKKVNFEFLQILSDEKKQTTEVDLAA